MNQSKDLSLTIMVTCRPSCVKEAQKMIMTELHTKVRNRRGREKEEGKGRRRKREKGGKEREEGKGGKKKGEEGKRK